MILSHIIVAIAWIVYGAIHSIFASTSVKKKMKATMGNAYISYRFWYSILAFLFLLMIVIYQITLPTFNLYQGNFYTNITGSLIAGGGFYIMAICIRNYFNKLSGIEWLTKNEDTVAIGTELVMKGIHKKVRHPLYLGTFLFIWGLLVIYPTGTMLVCDIVITLYTLIGIRFEERKLLVQFGEQYARYMRDVPMIVPKIYPLTP